MQTQDQSLDEDTSFDALAKLAYRESGILLEPEKKLMVQSRLRPRLKALGIRSMSEYLKLISSQSEADEIRHMISALTTNVSNFFRETHHFEFLREKILEAVTKKSPERNRIRIWSAGCSNGQEPITMAISLLNNIPNIQNFDIKILATDIDRDVLRFAATGMYPERMTTGLTKRDLNRYFEKMSRNQEEFYFQVAPEVSDMIVFKELNLLGAWPMKSCFDAIFCRNVVIYFDAETQDRLWPKFYRKLCPGGLFCLGHSERMADPNARGFEPIGPTAYTKIASEAEKLEVDNGAT